MNINICYCYNKVHLEINEKTYSVEIWKIILTLYFIIAYINYGNSYHYYHRLYDSCLIDFNSNCFKHGIVSNADEIAKVINYD